MVQKSEISCLKIKLIKIYYHLRYRSKFRPSVLNEERTRRQGSHQTMGHAKVPLNDPKDFLKKGDVERKLNEQFSHQKAMSAMTREEHNHRITRPPVPNHTDRPILGMKTTKDFVKQNAVETIIACPKQPRKIYVDTRRGDKYALEPSGLEPVYIRKKEFGKVPDYLEKRKDEVNLAKEEYNRYVSEHFAQGEMQKMPEEERESLICGLKKNWEELHREYQTLSVVIDTVPKKQRKDRLERQMKQLEKDIELLEAHPIIYISDDNQFYF